MSRITNKEKILNALNQSVQELSVSQLANSTDIDVKNIGRYLKDLENERIITIRKEQDGKIRTKYVSLNKPQQSGVISTLSKNTNLFDIGQFISDKVSSEEVAILDNNSEWLGIPKSHLMECAGYSFTMEIIKRYNLNKNSSSKVIIFCGTGNNGGDGFVIARHLSSFGIRSLVVLLGNPRNIKTQEAKQNWDIISNNLNYLIQIKLIKDSTDIELLATELDESNGINIIVDGLLGTGIKGNIREPISAAIDFINKLRKIKKNPIVSIDVPSGLDPNTGIVAHKAIKSDLVITFHRNKRGMTTDSEFVKEICVRSIGIPWEASLFVGRGDLMPTLKVRNIDNHKGQFGRVLVIGGSKNYSGAPAYSSLTGIHFGCDLVITYVPQVVGDVIRNYSPNLIVRTQPGDWLNTDALDEISWLIDWSNAIVIGPGMGVEKETENLLVKLLEILKEKKKSYVLDADALKLIKNHLDLIKGQQVILTPHEEEIKVMTNIELPQYSSIEERGKIVYNLANKLDVTLIVKGPYDFISDGKQLKINRTGCPEMSMGGTGDVLAGLCACFLTTNNNPFHSACSAAFLNGYLGEYCKKSIGPRFTTTLMIENINESILNLINEK
jgi:hydroxyethylthiazole kinase-like uncharacterized protein yjeF